jgi:hypothetical protein
MPLSLPLAFRETAERVVLEVPLKPTGSAPDILGQ